MGAILRFIVSAFATSFILIVLYGSRDKIPGITSLIQTFIIASFVFASNNQQDTKSESNDLPDIINKKEFEQIEYARKCLSQRKNLSFAYGVMLHFKSNCNKSMDSFKEAECILLDIERNATKEELNYGMKMFNYINSNHPAEKSKKNYSIIITPAKLSFVIFAISFVELFMLYCPKQYDIIRSNKTIRETQILSFSDWPKYGIDHYGQSASIKFRGYDLSVIAMELVLAGLIAGVVYCVKSEAATPPTTASQPDTK